MTVYSVNLIKKPTENYAQNWTKFSVVFLFLYDMLSSIPTRLPIRIVKAVHPDAFAGGYVNKLIFAEVNTAVRCAFFISGEEDEVAGFKFGALFDAFAELILLVGRTGKRETVLFENVLDKSGTVESFWCCPAENVFRSSVFFCRLNDGVHFAFRKKRRLFGDLFHF